MNNQEFFDKSVAHLRKQGRTARAFRDGDTTVSCMYRTPEGLGCAVGGTMPDDLVAKVLASNGNTWRFGLLASDVPEVGTFYRGVDHSLIGRMQQVHDNYEQPEWELRFRRVAGQHDLVYTPPAEPTP